jgi:hypothetical protein
MTDPREVLAIIAQHRRQIEQSPGIGVERQTYALDMLDDIERDLRASSGDPPAEPELLRLFKKAVFDAGDVEDANLEGIRAVVAALRASAPHGTDVPFPEVIGLDFGSGASAPRSEPTDDMINALANLFAEYFRSDDLSELQAAERAYGIVRGSGGRPKEK